MHESAELVVVGGWLEDDGAPCTSQLVTDSVTVVLEEPLGDRTVVDAVTGNPLLRE